MGHGQFCPVAVASDVFANRWTPLILREFFAGATRFNEIKRCLPLISRTTLAQRLRALEMARVIECVDQGRDAHYKLTPAGEEFQPIIRALGFWGQRWAPRFDAANLDAGLLMWNVRRRLEPEKLPPGRTVVRFEFSGCPLQYRREKTFWLIIAEGAADLCFRDPGFEIDLHVEADIGAFARVWLGDLTFAEALRTRQLRLFGTRPLVRAFPTWLKRSPYAEVPRPLQANQPPPHHA
jgi:DNA-binding HxlR family transcriptional regulator